MTSVEDYMDYQRDGHRCPMRDCQNMLQNVRPAPIDAATHPTTRPWLGWCPDHGTVVIPEEHQ